MSVAELPLRARSPRELGRVRITLGIKMPAEYHDRLIFLPMASQAGGGVQN